MKAICPEDSTHDEFVTSAHIAQLWVVDSVGDFISVAMDCTDVTHHPESGNIWECNICGADAVVE